MKHAIAGLGLTVISLVMLPLLMLAGCMETDTPIVVPVAHTETIDGFGPLDPTAVPDPTYVPWLQEAGTLCPEIPASLLAAQIDQESSWNPNAQSTTVEGLHTGGAQGLAQFMPATWAEIGRDDDGNGTASPFDPGDAIMAQGRYMCQLVSAITSNPDLADTDVVSLALAAYNAGLNNVEKYGDIPPFAETQAYVPAIGRLAVTTYSGRGEGATTPPAPIPSTGDNVNAAILAAALPHAGLPYVWGGGTLTGPSGIDAIGGRGPGFDCSGLVRYAVYQGTGGAVELPRTSRDQGQPGPHVIEVDANHVQPGDIVAFKFGDRNGSNANDWTHIGIVSATIGGIPTQMFNAAQSGTNLGYADLTRTFYAESSHAYFRIVL